MSATFTFEKTCLLAVQLAAHYNVSLVAAHREHIYKLVQKSIASKLAWQKRRLHLAEGGEDFPGMLAVLVGTDEAPDARKRAAQYQRMLDKLDKFGLPPSCIAEARKMGAYV